MQSAHIIGVVGGSGGVGASVLAAAVAVRAAGAGLRTVCLDGDRLGGGLDVTLGIEQERGVRWPDLAGARGRIDGPELVRRLPSVDGVAVLSFDRARDIQLTAEILLEVLHSLSVAADLVVVDLPRPDHEIFRALAPSVDDMILIAGSGICDLAGASVIADHVIRACPHVWLCLRTHGNGSHFADTVSGALDLPLLAEVREEPSLGADLLHGIPPGTCVKGAFAVAADAVLAQCARAVATGRLMSVSPTVWAQIRAGRAPTQGLVAQVLDDQAVVLGEAGALRARAELAAQVLGAGPLESLLADPLVTDVLVNAGSGVWVDRGDGLTRTDCEIGDERAVRRLAVRLAGIAGRRLDDISPYVDGLLPGGVRLHAVLPPIAVEGSHISLRVPRRLAPTLVELARWGTFGAGWLRVLEALVSRRCSFVVSGGTGSGKTTLLGAWLGEVDVRERLVIVEDVRELAISHPHVVRLQARPANVEGRGETGLTSLVRQSLRMRPDRLVVGEVRGAEVREMLAALNTGHEGGCSTLHANTSADVVARFEALGALAGLAPTAVHAQLLSAVQVVVHVRRGCGRRLVDTVAVLARGANGSPEVRSALTRGADAGTVVGTAWPALARLLDLDPDVVP